MRWGGDYRRSPDENHLQIDVSPGDERLLRVVSKLAGLTASRDGGAGTGAHLPFTPERRERARAVQRRQGSLD